MTDGPFAYPLDLRSRPVAQSRAVAMRPSDSPTLPLPSSIPSVRPSSPSFSDRVSLNDPPAFSLTSRNFLFLFRFLSLPSAVVNTISPLLKGPLFSFSRTSSYRSLVLTFVSFHLLTLLLAPPFFDRDRYSAFGATPSASRYLAPFSLLSHATPPPAYCFEIRDNEMPFKRAHELRRTGRRRRGDSK